MEEKKCRNCERMMKPVVVRAEVPGGYSPKLDEDGNKLYICLKCSKVKSKEGYEFLPKPA